MKPTCRIYFLLMTGMLCWSCQKEDEPQETGPETLIIGKWELVRDSVVIYNYPISGNTEILVDDYIPGGYVEFLPDGRLAWYDYQTKLYIMFEGKYLAENTIYSGGVWRIDTYNWYLRHTNYEEYRRQRIEIGSPFGLPYCHNDIISFVDKHTIILKLTFMTGHHTDFYHIYKRKE